MEIYPDLSPIAEPAMAIIVGIVVVPAFIKEKLR